jgi:general secretion pathway protein G
MARRSHGDLDYGELGIMKTHDNRSRMRAFTLLELLMVVVIIGLLAAFVVPNFIRQPDIAREGLTRAAIAGNGSLPTALKMFKVAVGRYPTTDEGLKVLVEPPSDDTLATKWKNGGGPFIDDIKGLKDPWGHDYIYECPGTYNKDGFDLSSPGLDGESGTSDDIRNWEQT